VIPKILCHGGVAAPASAADGAEAAARAGARLLARGALEAAVAATVALEDDPRFNAGTTSNACLDGRTVEMDAAVMDSTGRLGAVAAIRRVRNPVLAARAVCDSPHVLLVGEGATRLARKLGLRGASGVRGRAREMHAEAMVRLRENRPGGQYRGFRGGLWRTFWNFPGEAPAPDGHGGRRLAGGEHCSDTVGAVAMDRFGRFAATSSTGGCLLMLMGRVGDSPIAGAGLYAGSAGAVTCTGLGEEIIRRVLAYRVYLWMEEGVPAQKACDRAVALFPRKITVGILALDRAGTGIAANRRMPAAGVAVRGGTIASL
jgi:isoaspartyl peptidase/L-asparaginase-like protein (Ntn-hydrolase superfamily)